MDIERFWEVQRVLIQFSVENYRSIRDRMVLSMLASNDGEHPEHLIENETKDRYLKSEIICGANASGKSNVLSALWFMIYYVLTSHEKQLNILTGRIPFKFDPEMLDKPSSFEVIFVAEGVRYVYGFSATDKCVVEEYLYHYPNGRRALVFERQDTDNYRFTTDVDLQESLKERNSANKLYLSTAANWNYKKVLPAFNWFVSGKFLNASTGSTYGENGDALREDSYRDRIAKLMQVADLGIQGLKVKEGAPSVWGNFFGTLDNIETIHQVKDIQGNWVQYSLNMNEESTGTSTYFRLIGEVDRALQTGCLLIADEMDAYLHPLLTRYILSLFNSNETNPKGAQLLFATHNASLLDLDLLRRDQIWFTDKDEETGATELYSLYDFSVRKDTKIEKGYLLGKFGAIPYIRGGMNH